MARSQQQQPEVIASRLLTVGTQPPDGREADFKIFTAAMTVLSKAVKKAADGDEDSRNRIRCIASSTITDRHGDVMTDHCVRSMAKQAPGLTIFLNHSYDVPEDLFGTVEKARTKRMTAAEARSLGILSKETDPAVATDITKSVADNETVVLLELDVALDPNPRAQQTFTSIETRTRLGVSIGAYLTDYKESEEADPNDWFPPLVINDVDLLEASVVGIPANQLSWVEGAMKGALIRKGMLDREATLGDAYKAIEKGMVRSTQEVIAEPDEEFEAEAAAPELIVEACPTCGGDRDNPQGNCADAYHSKEAAPDLLEGEEPGASNDVLEALSATDPDVVKAAQVTPEARASSDPGAATEAPQSDPEAAEEAIPTSVEAQAELERLAQLGMLTPKMATLLKSAFDEIVKLRSQRDELVNNLAVAKQIVDGMMALPIGRKTSFARPASAFRARVAMVYGEDFAKLVEETRPQRS